MNKKSCFSLEDNCKPHDRLNNTTTANYTLNVQNWKTPCKNNICRPPLCNTKSNSCVFGTMTHTNTSTVTK